MKSCQVLLALLVTTVAAGCARPVSIRSVGIQPSQPYPRVSYDFNSVKTQDTAYFDRMDSKPLLRFEFETQSDLQRLARDWQVASLYYVVFDCSNPERYQRTGDIFPVASGDGIRRYDAYLPARFADYTSLAEDGRLKEWPRDLPLAKGLCFRVQGFGMAGFGVRSNTLRVDDLLDHIER